MMDTKQHAPISAIHEILKWSTSRPDWQRDALRRIVVKGTIDDADLRELSQLCRSKHMTEFVNNLTLKGEPIDASRVPPGSGSEASVTLVSIGNLCGVNRLPSDQIIPFGAAPGLTVIYGDTGAGKSGYARVLKKACRTRGAPPIIHPNAFVPATLNPATGTIVCRVTDTDCPLSWKDGVPSDPRLANVFVFDMSSAGHYLEQDGPATFTPRGLDVLPKLSKVCDAINQFIKQDMDRLKEEIIAATKNWNSSPTTSVGKLLERLGANTKPADVEALSVLDKKQVQHLKELTDALKSDPKQKAKETRAAAARLKTFAQKVREASTNLSEERISALRKFAEKAKTSTEAAKAFATGQFNASSLPGTGDELWRELWEAARSFSVSVAYKDQSFPVTGADARCVLCQRDLDGPTAERLKAFDAFCKDQSQQMAEQAAKLLKDAAEKVQEMDALASEYTKVEADMLSAPQEQPTSIADFVSHVDDRLATIKDSLLNGIWMDPVAISPCPANVVAAMADALEMRAKTEESADDPEIRKKLEIDRDELAAREWLATVKADVLAQIERHKKVAVLVVCQKDTATAPITSKNTELTKLLVTGAFCERFQIEVKELGLRTLTVKLEGIEGKKGETKFGLRIESASGLPVREVASEGEQRCIALAAFLAELSQASHQSALVFDDPVSSLDHWYCGKIAERLVRESKTRQVIVFTHDTVFLNDLETHAREYPIPAAFRFLEWNGSEPGWCRDGLPWDWKSTDDRFDKLGKEHRALEKVWSQIPNEENVHSMRQAYSWLRATLERIVEKEIFADVIFRFRSYVDVKKLKGVIGFSNTECQELQRLVQRCHDVTEAHDPSPGKHAAVPEPNELAKDIADAKELLAQVRARRKASTTTGSPASPPIPSLSKSSI